MRHQRTFSKMRKADAEPFSPSTPALSPNAPLPSSDNITWARKERSLGQSQSLGRSDAHRCASRVFASRLRRPIKSHRLTSDKDAQANEIISSDALSPPG